MRAVELGLASSKLEKDFSVAFWQRQEIPHSNGGGIGILARDRSGLGAYAADDHRLRTFPLRARPLPRSP